MSLLSKNIKVCVSSTFYLSETPTKLGSSSEREVLCVSLKKDPKLGLGKLINRDMIVDVLFCFLVIVFQIV